MGETSTASQFITTKELAALIRKTPKAVRMMRHRGQAPAGGFRCGRDVLWPRAGVEAWLRERAAADEIGQRASA